MKRIIGIILLVLLLGGCMKTPAVITDVYRDGDVLVFRKAVLNANTLSYQITESHSHEVRISLK